jgi:hypothetical protein
LLNESGREAHDSLKAILPDGTEVLLARQSGDVFCNGPVTHKVTNTGKTPIHNLIVELRNEK